MKYLIKSLIWGIFLLIISSFSTVAAAFDHQHQAWHTLVKKHVRWIDGVASQVDYAGFQNDHTPLKTYPVTTNSFFDWRGTLHIPKAVEL